MREEMAHGYPMAGSWQHPTSSQADGVGETPTHFDSGPDVTRGLTPNHWAIDIPDLRPTVQKPSRLLF